MQERQDINRHLEVKDEPEIQTKTEAIPQDMNLL